MDIAVASTYFLIVCLWLVVLTAVIVIALRGPRIFGATRLLLIVVFIDTTRNIIENFYFGLYFSARYGIISGSLRDVLDNSHLVILPKAVNVVAACVVLGLLLLRWLPMALKERADAEDNIRRTAEALEHESRARRVLFEENEYIANFDQLSGLPNLRRLQHDLNDPHLREQDPGHGMVALATFGIDCFKDVKDTLGPGVGDTLQCDIARRLGEAPPETGRFYWTGDGEFTLLVPRCDGHRTFIDAVSSVLRRQGDRFEIDGHRFFITVSAGIAFSDPWRLDANDIMSNGALALRDAKAAGGGIYRLYSPMLRAEAQARLALDAELRRAVADKEFVLHFQPQIRLADGTIVGAEALLRWRHPTRGLVQPGDFIEALGKSQVAAEVGQWVLESACTVVASWRAEGLPAVRVGVNLFPAQFRDGSLLRNVKSALDLSGLPAEALEIEITEDIALGNDLATIDMLTRLKDIGVSLAFDDFGTGYASLSYLAKYPLARIKIDRSFVGTITDTSAKCETAIVRSIITMAHNLGLKVVAEGVETPAQADFLRAEGCEEAQGFLFAEPLPAAQFRALLTIRPTVLAAG